MKNNRLLVVLPIIIFAIHVSRDSTINPPPWPDEAIYTDISINIIIHGNAGTTLWAGMVPGVENQALWYPQLFFYLTAIWQYVNGFSIEALRLFALIISILAFSSISLSLNYSKKWAWLAIVILIVLALDYQFVRNARIFRPEFINVALLFIINQLILKQSTIWLGGFLCGIMILIHPITIIFLIAYLLWLKINASTYVLPFIISMTLPIAVWGILVWPYHDILISQQSLMFMRKNAEETWMTIMSSQSSLWLIRFICFGTTTLLFWWYLFFKKPKMEQTLIGLLLCGAWVIALYGKMEWYYVYLYPLSYLALFYTYILLSKPHRIIVKGFLCLLAITSLMLSNQAAKIIKANAFNLNEHYNAIKDAVPDNSVVFLSSIPDPYFALNSDQKQHSLIEFPTLPLTEADYITMLNKVDFIVFNGHYDYVLHENLLPEYIKTHFEVYKHIHAGGFQTTVYQRVPKS